MIMVRIWCVIGIVLILFGCCMKMVVWWFMFICRLMGCWFEVVSGWRLVSVLVYWVILVIVWFCICILWFRLILVCSCV